MRNLIAWGLGVLFALGLGVSGMTLPSKILDFLDFFGRWDPSLLFVMASAIPVYMVVWMARRRRVPWLGGKLPVARKDLDANLVVGAALFGVGWGLAGICPGPAITIMGRPTSGAVVFLAAVLCGMLVYRLFESVRSSPKTVT